MSSCKHLFLLFALIVLLRFDPIRPSPMEDMENDKKYIAYEETVIILKVYEELYKEYGNQSALNIHENITYTFEEMNRKYFSVNTSVDASKLKLYLYTSDQPDGVKVDFDNLEEVEFNPSNPTRIICHGWMSSAQNLVVKSIAQAYLNKGRNNIIGVDWSAYSKDIVYPLAVKYTEGVGKCLAKVIDAIVEKRNAKYSDIHIIGHSLGAHVAGFAGSNTKEKIGRITGLDPALPGFQYVRGREGRLDDTDATFVDAIHTCSGLLGMSVPVGHVDFFPNGGSPFQPGCLTIVLPQSTACSHGRSYQYFAESITGTSKFTAIKCEHWKQFKAAKCSEEYALMGEPVPRDSLGVFYLSTNDHTLFARGTNGTIY